MSIKDPIRDLSDNQIDKIVDKLFKKDFSKATPQENPSVILVVGPPGVGKSNSKNSTLSKIGFAVDSDADMLREKHPDYAEACAHKDFGSQYAIGRLRPFVRTMEQKIKKRALSENLNLIKEGTGKSSESSIEVLREARKHGHQTSLIMIVEPHAVSLQGTKDRYDSQTRKNSSTARAVPADFHGACFNNQPTFLKDIIKSKLADEITLRNREGKILAHSIRKDGMDHNEAYLLKVMEKHREPKAITQSQTPEQPAQANTKKKGRAPPTR